MRNDPGEQILERSVMIAFLAAGVGFFATIILDSIVPFLLIGSIGILIALVGVFAASSASKEHEQEIYRMAAIADENTERRKREKHQKNILRLQGEAISKEKNLDYKGAIEIWDYLGNHAQAKKIRIKMQENNRVKVDQTVVQGDYVDDRDTIVKDSVLNRSNVGAGGKTKGERIKLIKELLDSGAIDDDEFKQMKKEILEG
jgi:hypothetical protein